MTDTTKIPEPGPARDRLVAELLGWTAVGEERNAQHTECVDHGMRPGGSRRETIPRYSASTADALAALEAWCAADPTRGYRIDRYGGEGLDYLVVLYATLSMRVIGRGEDDTLAAAATAALLATKGEAS